MQIQERIFNPTMLDVRNSFPATPESQQHVALVMDVSAAHKRIKLHPSQKGYSAFSLNGLAYQYRTCHFGATYSAYYWGRLAGFLHRVAHRLLFNSHRGFIYVDDWLWIFRKEWAVIQAFLVTCLWNVLGLPMSWHKTTMSSTVTWLGWQINLEEMTISVTQEKFDKMFSLLPAKIPERMRRKDLESVVGVLMWISQVIPHLKSNLATLYHDCAQGSVSAKFVQPKLLQSIIESCSSNLHMLSNVGSIKSGCKLLKISRHPVSSQEQARALARQFQGGWIVLYDIRSRNVNLSQASIHFLQTTRQMLQGKMVWFTKLTVLFFLEGGWVGGVCWVVVLRGLRNFLVRMLSSQYWLCIVEHLLWQFLFQNISVKMSDSVVNFVHFSCVTFIDVSLFVVTL